MKRIAIALVLCAPVLLAGRCEEQLDRAKKNIKRIVDDSAPIADAAAPLIPQPWRSVIDIILLLGGGFATLRARQNKAAARSIVKGIANLEKTGLLTVAGDVASEFASNQTPRAKRIVDEVEGKTKVVLPI